MRGNDVQQLDVFRYVSPEQRVPHDRLLRPVRVMTSEALQQLQPRFRKLYAKTGRPSIAPENLLRALLLVHAKVYPSPRCTRWAANGC
jgi:transposase